MAPTRKVEVAIVGDASSMVRAFRQADNAAGRFGKGGSRLGAIGMGLLAGGAAGLTVAVGQGLVSAFQTGVREFSEAQKVSAQTAAALKSTGNAAGVTQQHIEQMASSMQRQTGLQDDNIQSAQNLLLTFTKISNAGPDKIFDRATRATADLSVALGKDMGSSAIMVGKALNDPIKGVSALGRAGVQFTAGQKETIKSLVETGRVADAQKLILKELETQVGGSAKAFGETTPGQVERAKRAFEDMSQGIITAAAPLAAAVLPGITAAINGVTTFFQANWPKIQEVAQRVWQWFSTNLLPTFISIGQSIGSIVMSIVSVFRTYWPQIMAVVRPAVAFFAGTVKTTFQAIAGVIKLVASILRGDFSGAWNAIKQIGKAVLDGVVNIIKNIPTALWNAATGTLKAAFDLGKKVVEKIAEGIGSLPGLIKRGLSHLFGIAGEEGAVNPYLNAMRGVGGKIPDAVAAGITGGKGKVSRGMSVMVGGATSDAKGSATGKGQPVGRAISSGIAEGVRNNGSAVGGAISQVIRDGISQGKREAGIKSPSRVTADQIGKPMSDGIATGIQENARKPAAALKAVIGKATRSAFEGLRSQAASAVSSLAPMYRQLRESVLSNQVDFGAGVANGMSLNGMRDTYNEAQMTRRENQLIKAKNDAEANADATEEERQAARDALSDFYTEKEIARREKEVAKQSESDEKAVTSLASRFKRGEISAEEFQTQLDALIGGQTGADLGKMFGEEWTAAFAEATAPIAEIIKEKLGGLTGETPDNSIAQGRSEDWNTKVENVRKSLERQWKKAHPGANFEDDGGDDWVRKKLRSWKKANAARYGVALAAGGITTGPTNALIGEAGREAVLPLEGPRAKRMLRSTGIGGPTVNLTFNGVLNAKDAARMLRPELDRLVRLAV